MDDKKEENDLVQGKDIDENSELSKPSESENSKINEKVEEETGGGEKAIDEEGKLSKDNGKILERTDQSDEGSPMNDEFNESNETKEKIGKEEIIEREEKPKRLEDAEEANQLTEEPSTVEGSDKDSESLKTSEPTEAQKATNKESHPAEDVKKPIKEIEQPAENLLTKENKIEDFESSKTSEPEESQQIPEKIVKNDLSEKFEELEVLNSSSTRVLDRTDKKRYIVLRIHDPNTKNIYKSISNKRIAKIERELDETTLLLKDPGEDYKPLSNLIKSGQNIEKLLSILEKLAYTIFSLNKIGYVFLNFNPSKFLVSETDEEIFIHDLTNVVKKGTKISGIFTPYTPPEAMRETSADEISDVYGLGSLVYETLFGQKIPEDLDYVLIGKNINKPYIAQLLSKCISMERERRFPSTYSVAYGIKKLRENLHKKHYNIEHSEFSNIGINPSRAEDEDSAGLVSYRIIVRGKSELVVAFALADGMGGGEAGDVASEVAIKTFFNNFLRNLNNIKDENANQFIRNFVVKSNEEILKIKNEKKISEIGTTFVGGIILGNKLYIGNIGDSRAYLIRDDDLKQLTKDHSLVQKLIDNGGNKEEILKTTNRSIITKNLGASKFEPDYVDTLETTLKEEYIELKNNDKILLCCDGVWDALSEDEIKEIIGKEKNIDELSKELVEKSIEKDGSDNATVLLLNFIETDEWIINNMKGR